MPEARVARLVESGLDGQHGGEINVGQLLDAAFELAVNVCDACVRVDFEVVDNSGVFEADPLGERNARRSESGICSLYAAKNEIGLLRVDDRFECRDFRGHVGEPGLESVVPDPHGAVGPFASAIRIVSSARSGPMVTVTTSSAIPASASCTAASIA